MIAVSAFAPAVLVREYGQKKVVSSRVELNTRRKLWEKFM
jgi:hypothetical protein